jgi:TonB family protein
MRPLSGVALALAVLASTSVAAQSASQPAAPPQTARQALIEMFFGQTPNHLEKHLPDVTRQAFQNIEGADGKSALGMFSMIAAEAHNDKDKYETFDTGSTLFTAKNPPGGTYDKIDVRVERDDLSGDEDQIELTLHMTQKGKEEKLPFILSFTFTMKMESEIWRLNEISAGVRLPLADPNFLKAILEHQRSQNEQMALVSMRSVRYAETSYQAANSGFACTLAALGSANKVAGGAARRGYLYDSELVTGKKYGYVFAISECDSSHCQLVAEPGAANSGQRAFCSDESGTVRASADGKAATCLSGGEVVEQQPAAIGVLAGGVPAQGTVSSGTSSPGTSSPALLRGPLLQRVRVSQGVIQGLIVTKVPPVYPPDARSARIQGTVVLKALISPTGDVESLSLISGHPMLAPAAIEAVKQWKYRPYLLNGNAVTVDTEITVNFTLSEP